MDHIQDRMTDGSIAGKLVRFAVPLFIGNLFQQLYNTADALIVGNMLGNDALAAVSSTGTLVFLLVSFFAGISAGAGVAISRYYGAREHDKMELAIHTNIAFNIVAGILLTIVGVCFTPTILRWMSTPEDVFEQAALYVRIYFAGSLGLVMYNSCRGIMQAVGDSKHPLYYLIISSVLNVILDIVFIGVFKTDVDGAALATILAQFISFFLCAGRLLCAISFRSAIRSHTIRHNVLRRDNITTGSCIVLRLFFLRHLADARDDTSAFSEVNELNALCGTSHDPHV